MTNQFLNQKNSDIALKIVRENIKSYLNDTTYESEIELDDIFYQKRGVFVTLNKNHNLRGCIGYIEAYEPLIDGLLDVSLSAAFDDPRFYPLTKEEFENIEIEISILTKPELIQVNDYKQYLSEIKIGKDGLIIENKHNKGVFLPQVPIEQNWNMEEYLENLCYKAALEKNAWQSDETKIYKFQAQIIKE